MADGHIQTRKKKKKKKAKLAQASGLSSDVAYHTLKTLSHIQNVAIFFLCWRSTIWVDISCIWRTNNTDSVFDISPKMYTSGVKIAARRAPPAVS